MKLLIFSDLHVNDWLDCSYGEKNDNTRFLDSMNVLDQLFECKEKYKADFIIFGGDLFHKRSIIRTELVDMTMGKLLSNHDIWDRLLVNVGNHDISLYGNTSIFDLWKEFKGLSYSDQLKSIEEDDDINNLTWLLRSENGEELRVVFVPYIKNGSEKLVEIAEKIERLDVDVVFWHCGVEGFHYFDISMPAGRIPKNCWNFFGHFHNFRKIKNKCYFIGSPLQLNWGDEGIDKYFILFDTKLWKIKKIPVKAPKFVTIDFDQKLTNFEAYSLINNNFIKLQYKVGDNWKLVRDEFLSLGARFVKPEVKIVYLPDNNSKLKNGNMDVSKILLDYVRHNVEEKKVKEYYEIMKKFI